jgi:hypothetical protein
MNDSNPQSSNARPVRPAWNKGKLTGPKPPLRPGHVWSIRAKLQLERRTRDSALFNLAIDSKLRGCDLVALCVADVAPNGYAIDRANVRQRKTSRPVRFELTEVTRHLDRRGPYSSHPTLAPEPLRGYVQIAANPFGEVSEVGGAAELIGNQIAY